MTGLGYFRSHRVFHPSIRFDPMFGKWILGPLLLCFACSSPEYVPKVFEETFPFSKSDRVELLSYPNRNTWDTIPNEQGFFSDEIVTSNGKVTIPSRHVKDRIRLDTVQQRRLFDLLCNEPCEEGMVAACYDPRHAVIFYDEKGKAYAFVELCLECLQAHHTEGVPVQFFCADKINALEMFFRSCGVTYFRDP